jgi:hypothetical protein
MAGAEGHDSRKRQQHGDHAQRGHSLERDIDSRQTIQTRIHVFSLVLSDIEPSPAVVTMRPLSAR